MGKITVVGIGPGSPEEMTPKAHKTIEEAQVVVGYTTYISLIEPMLKDKEIIGTGMMQEVDRCKMAVEAAANGRDTVVVSSGDAGIYGMAGLVLELVLQYPVEKRPEFGGTVAGVSAVNAAASVLGAPLMHDFAVISLSDFSDLAHFTEEEIGMFSIVIIGNSHTYVKDGYMVTPRGYKV